MKPTKLTTKHERVTLGSEGDIHKCDICQECPAVMLCAEDRALLCRRCDLRIHTANELVAKHSRFLLSPVSIGLHALPPVPVRDAHADALSSHNPSCSGSLVSNTHFSTSQLYSRGYGEMGPPMDKGKGPAALQYSVDRRDNGLPQMGNGIAHASSSGAGLLSPSMDSIRGNAGAQALLRGVAQRSTGNEDSPYHSRQEEQLLVPGGQRRFSHDFDAYRMPGLTLAADLLGVPTMSTTLTAKDVDVSYAWLDNELDDEISALLEVPDIDYGSIPGSSSRPPSFDMPGSYRQLFPGPGGYAGMSGSRGRRNSLELPTNSGGDGVVPDLGGSNGVYQTKRQRS
eukprot:jgi/Botrbrau1/12601/Bobra.0169s0129.1